MDASIHRLPTVPPYGEANVFEVVPSLLPEVREGLCPENATVQTTSHRRKNTAMTDKEKIIEILQSKHWYMVLNTSKSVEAIADEIMKYISDLREELRITRKYLTDSTPIGLH